MSEQEGYRPSPEEMIEANLGKEALQEAAEFTKGLFKMMKVSLAEISMGEGSSTEKREKAERELEMWKEFSNGLFARIMSQNHRSPERVRTAIEGATALLGPEPLNQMKAPAQKMVDVLKRDYGVK